VNRSAGYASSKQRAGKFPSEADCSFEDTVVNLSSNQSVETPVVIFMTGHKADPEWDSFIRGVRGLILWKPFQMHELLTAMRTIFRRSRLLELDQQYRALAK
jgi:DNA-binding response OmpR family regulator